METRNQLGSFYSNPDEDARGLDQVGSWMYFEGLPRLCPETHWESLSTSAKQAEELGLESWFRSPSPVGQSTFPFMPVTSHVTISYSVIRCPFNSWTKKGMARCSSYPSLHL